MNKLHSLAFYALVTPTIAMGSGVLLAEQSADKDGVEKQQSTEHGEDTMESTSNTMPSDQKADHQAGMQNESYMHSSPADGMRATDLIGAEVITAGDEEVGSVSELIIDKNGQVVFIVVGVGGFLSMGEKDVAIGWENVTRSSSSDKYELRIDVTREELQSAAEFKKQQ
ncbi:PRC-barrel domain-containing protein [Marinobacter sp. M1N3S26]|uniref:PRC-barrel domain-containing protein n=1 Tax=Marinobacter sp. M1N3S26 TaxID=3382299 RepID=UPI00387B5419